MNKKILISFSPLFVSSRTSFCNSLFNMYVSAKLSNSHTLLLLFFLFSINFSFSQSPNLPINQSPNKVDSLLSLLKDLEKGKTTTQKTWQTYPPFSWFFDKDTSAQNLDVQKIDILNQLSYEYLNKDTALAAGYSRQALELAQKHNYQKGVANAYHNIGIIYYNQSDYPKAMDYYFMALKITEELGDKSGMASSYINIGNIYYHQSDYPKAMDYYSKSLKILEELGDKKGMAYSYNNIGVIFENQSDYPKAMDYYFMALKIREELGDKKGMADSYNNIGVIFENQSDYPKAKGYYFKSLKIDEELGNKKGMAYSYINIGNIYYHQSDHPKAMDYYFKSLKIEEELGDKRGMAYSYISIAGLYTTLTEQPDSVKQIYIQYHYTDKGSKPKPSLTELNSILLEEALQLQLKAKQINTELSDEHEMTYSLTGIGNVYLKKKNYREALANFAHAALIADTLSAEAEYRDAAKGLYESYLGLGRYREALQWHEKYIVARDSVKNEETYKQIAGREFRYVYEKQEAVNKVEMEKMAALSEADRKRAASEKRFLSWGFLITVVFSSFIVYFYLLSRRRNKMLDIANKEVVEQKKTVEESKKIIETKHKDLTDSIEYASYIQQAVLPDKKTIMSVFLDIFLKYIPKDVVSGDFYFFSRVRKFLLVALADSTGHGVPGALISMLGTDMLNQIVNDHCITLPADVLLALDKLVLNTFYKPEGDTGRSDGMDIGFVAINTETMMLQFAGANRHLYFARNGVITEYRGDKFPIGDHPDPDKKFTNHSIPIQSGDLFYLFTDGITDQFGGAKNKKLGRRRWKELIQSICSKPIREQELLLQQAISDWKGNNEQTDDITIIGVRI